MREVVKLGNTAVPLVAEPPGGAVVFVGTYPALLGSSEVYKQHGLRKVSKEARIPLLPDYLVEQDLPSAYQEFIRQAGVKGQVAG